MWFKGMHTHTSPTYNYLFLHFKDLVFDTIKRIIHAPYGVISIEVSLL